MDTIYTYIRGILTIFPIRAYTTCTLYKMQKPSHRTLFVHFRYTPRVSHMYTKLTWHKEYFSLILYIISRDTSHDNACRNYVALY